MKLEKSILVKTPAKAFWKAMVSSGYQAQRGGFFECRWVANSNINWIASGKADSFYGKLLKIKELEHLSYLKYSDRVYNEVIALISYQIVPFGLGINVKISAEFMKMMSIEETKVQEKWLNEHLNSIISIALDFKQEMITESSTENIHNHSSLQI